MKPKMLVTREGEAELRRMGTLAVQESAIAAREIEGVSPGWRE